MPRQERMGEADEEMGRIGGDGQIRIKHRKRKGEASALGLECMDLYQTLFPEVLKNLRHLN